MGTTKTCQHHPQGEGYCLSRVLLSRVLTNALQITSISWLTAQGNRIISQDLHERVLKRPNGALHTSPGQRPGKNLAGAVHEPPLHPPQITRSHWYDHWPYRDNTNVGAVREPPQILTKMPNPE